MIHDEQVFCWAHKLNIYDVYVEISMYYLTYCAYDVACDADFYRTKRQIVLRVRDSEIQR